MDRLMVNSLAFAHPVLFQLDLAVILDVGSECELECF